MIVRECNERFIDGAWALRVLSVIHHEQIDLIYQVLRERSVVDGLLTQTGDSINRGHYVPGKKVPAFSYDSPGTLERGTYVTLLR
jgi:hypothetical protein